MKVCVSWSGGKESCLALHRVISEKMDVFCLLNFASKDGRCMAHGLNSKLVFAQSEALGIPLLQKVVTWQTYEHGFKEALSELKEKGAEGAVFGDIFSIPRHEGWIDRVCGQVGVKPIKPLWGKDSTQLLTEFVMQGFEATVIKAKANLLDETWVGRKVDRAFIRDILKLKNKKKLDPCGELGEYHTFVCDAPLFKKRIEILDASKKLVEGYWSLDIKEVGTTPK